MKKLLLIIALCLFSFNAYAYDFITTLGAECNRILYSLSTSTYPDRYDTVESRNKQLNSLEKCLNLYYRAGGHIDDLNKRYDLVSNGLFVNCENAKDVIDCFNLNTRIRHASFSKTYDKLQKDLANPIKYQPPQD